MREAACLILTMRFRPAERASHESESVPMTRRTSNVPYLLSKPFFLCQSEQTHRGVFQHDSLRTLVAIRSFKKLRESSKKPSLAEPDLDTALCCTGLVADTDILVNFGLPAYFSPLHSPPERQ